MQLNLSSPTTATSMLKDCRSGVVKAQANLSRRILVNCDSATLKSAATKLALIKNMLEGLERDLDEVIAEREPCCLECQSAADEWDRAGEDRLAMLDRVMRAEKEGLEPWHSFSPTKDDALHPVACGSPSELGVLAAGWDAEGGTL